MIVFLTPGFQIAYATHGRVVSISGGARGCCINLMEPRILKRRPLWMMVGKGQERERDHVALFSGAY
jgi:hypothetical protein